MNIKFKCWDMKKNAERLAYHNRFLYQKRIGWTFIHPISV